MRREVLFRILSWLFFILSVLLLYPVVRPFKFTSKRRPGFFVFVDPSESMLKNNGLFQARKIVNALAEDGEFNIKGIYMREENFTRYTDLGEFFREATAMARECSADAVIFISDGEHNRGVLPYEVNFPFYFVLVGSPRAGGVIVREVDFPPVVSRGQSFSVKLFVHADVPSKILLKVIPGTNSREAPGTFEFTETVPSGYSQVEFKGIKLEGSPGAFYQLELIGIPIGAGSSRVLYKGLIRISLEKPALFLVGRVSNEFSFLAKYFSDEGYPHMSVSFLPDGRMYMGGMPAAEGSLDDKVKRVVQNFASIARVAVVVDFPIEDLPDCMRKMVNSIPRLLFVGEGGGLTSGRYIEKALGEKWTFAASVSALSGLESGGSFPSIFSLFLPSSSFLSDKDILVKVDGYPLVVYSQKSSEIYVLTDTLWKTRLGDAYMGTNLYSSLLSSLLKMLVSGGGTRNFVEVYPDPVDAGDSVTVRVYSMGRDMVLKKVYPQGYFLEGAEGKKEPVEFSCSGGVCVAEFSPRKSGTLVVKVDGRVVRKDIAVREFNPEDFLVEPTADFIRQVKFSAVRILEYSNFSLDSLKRFAEGISVKGVKEISPFYPLCFSLIFLGLAWLMRWLS